MEEQCIVVELGLVLQASSGPQPYITAPVPCLLPSIKTSRSTTNTSEAKPDSRRKENTTRLRRFEEMPHSASFNLDSCAAGHCGKKRT